MLENKIRYNYLISLQLSVPRYFDILKRSDQNTADVITNEIHNLKTAEILDVCRYNVL